MLAFFRNRRRARWSELPDPPEWDGWLEKSFALYGRLNNADRRGLKDRMKVFLHEKHFEGCNGFALDEPARVLVAAQACLVGLGHTMDVYNSLRSILLYPAAFLAQHREWDPSGIVEESDSACEGESWDLGAVVLSWEDVARDAAALDDHNVVFHEFAHQLYHSGALLPEEHLRRADFLTVFQTHFECHVRDVDAGRRTLLDPYGATNLSEFFAVATEAFFEQPLRFRSRLPQLYTEMQTAYRQDPVRFFEEPAEAGEDNG